MRIIPTENIYTALFGDINDALSLGIHKEVLDGWLSGYSHQKIQKNLDTKAEASGKILARIIDRAKDTYGIKDKFELYSTMIKEGATSEISQGDLDKYKELSEAQKQMLNTISANRGSPNSERRKTCRSQLLRTGIISDALYKNDTTLALFNAIVQDAINTPDDRERIDKADASSGVTLVHVSPKTQEPDDLMFL